jgi:hypothetical protein
MLPNVGSSAIMLSTKVLTTRFTASNPNLLNLELIENSQQIFQNDESTILSYRLSQIVPNTTSQPSVNVDYTSTTTITDLVTGDPFAIVEVEGGGVGTYFNNVIDGKNFTLFNTPGKMRVNGWSLNFDGNTISSSETHRFAVPLKRDFLNFTLRYPRSHILNNNNELVVGNIIESTTLRFDSITGIPERGYLEMGPLRTPAPNPAVVPEPTTSVLTLLAIGMAGRFARNRFSLTVLKSKGKIV